MKKLLFYLTLFFSFGALAQGTKGLPEVGRPIDLKVQDLGADVPQECVAFFNQTGWGGWLSGRRAIELWVEKINPDCSAQVVYAWGPLSGGIAPSYVRRNVTISNGELRIDPVHSPGTNALFTIAKNSEGGEELVLVYQFRQGERTVTNNARLKKGIVFD